MRKLIKIFSVCFVIFVCPILFSFWLIGGELSRSLNQVVAAPPEELQAQVFDVGGVKGWYVKSKSESEKCVMLIHGLGADRTSMIARATFLKANGYSLLLFDLYGHGETKGEFMTFGYKESQDAKKVLEYARHIIGCKRVAAIGASLGGAACVLGDKPLAADAMILELVYPDIKRAVSNRMAMLMGSKGRIFAPFPYYQIPLRLGVALKDLRPIEGIKKIKAPVLIIAGGKDQRTLLSESQEFFEAAPSPKELWVVEDAAHVDIYPFAQEEYEKRVLDFLARYL